jgi:hypothetical protein
LAVTTASHSLVRRRRGPQRPSGTETRASPSSMKRLVDTLSPASVPKSTAMGFRQLPLRRLGGPVPSFGAHGSISIDSMSESERRGEINASPNFQATGPCARSIPAALLLTSGPGRRRRATSLL